MQLCTAATPPYDEIVTLACRAPSVHNSQPWLWRVTDTGLDLVADWSRHLAHTDPDGRDLVLSCGAVLHHLRVASRALGWRADVVYEPSSTARHAVLASVSFARAPVPAEAVRQLRALTERQTDRRAFATWPVPAGRVDELTRRVRSWQVDVTVVSDPHACSRLLDVTRRADEQQRRDPGYLDELTTWTRESEHEGVPAANSPVAGDPAVAAVPRRFPPGTLVDPRSVHPPGELLVLSTDDDDATAWLRSGEALSDLWLASSSAGLALVPLSQAVEVRQARRDVRTLLGKDAGHPQVVVRLGWPGPAHQSSLPRTPRGSAADVLVRRASSAEPGRSALVPAVGTRKRQQSEMTTTGGTP
jgi:hypothetical protein